MLSEHEACIIMNLIPGIGIARFRTLVQAAGSAAKALEMSYQDAIELKNIGQHAAAGLASWQENARWEEEITAAATAENRHEDTGAAPAAGAAAAPGRTARLQQHQEQQE